MQSHFLEALLLKDMHPMITTLFEVWSHKYDKNLPIQLGSQMKAKQAFAIIRL